MFWANILGLSVFVGVLAFAMIVAVMAGEAIYVDGIQAGIQLGEGHEPRRWILKKDDISEPED